jgi:hypothetical protein
MARRHQPDDLVLLAPEILDEYHSPSRMQPERAQNLRELNLAPSILINPPNLMP